MSSIVEKLQKLIAHERSARSIGSLAEAEIFASRIQHLLARHKLSMSQVECEAEDSINPIGTSRSPVHTAAPDQWLQNLAQGIAISMYCKVLWLRGGGSVKASAIFVGRETDRLTAAALFNYLFRLGLDLAAAAADKVSSSQNIGFHRESYRSQGHEKEFSEALRKIMRTWKRDYLRGYAVALYQRLTENKKNLEAEASADSTALILRDQKAIEQFCEQEFSVNQKHTRQRLPSLKSAFNRGYIDGNNVSIRSTAALPDKS